MAVTSGRTPSLAICLLLFIYRVEGGFRKPQTSLKHDYTIELQQVDMMSSPSEFYRPDTLYYTKLYNDSTRVLEADLYLVKPFPDDVTLSITIYEFNSGRNNWAETVTKEMSFCELMKQGSKYVENIFVTGNFTQECQHEPGYYVLRELLISTKEFPLHMEEKKWRVLVNFYPKSTKETFLSMAIILWSRPIDDDMY